MFVDFVEILGQYCQEKEYHYTAGRKAVLNLVNNSTLPLDKNKIYCLHEAMTRSAVPNKMQTTDEFYIFKGNFFLVVQSDLNLPYYNETGNDKAIGKYKKNVEPLLKVWAEMRKEFLCAGYELTSFEAIDVTDLFDANRDGVFVSYQIKIKA